MIWNQKFETMNREDLAQVQIERLQSMLNRARRNVAFYRQAFERSGVKVEDVRSLADLAHLPFTTPNDLHTWSECMARVLAAGDVTEHDVVQVSFTYGLFSGGLGFHYGAERIGASVVPASTGSLERQLMIMRDFKTSALACTPGYALALAGALADGGLAAGELSLRAGFFGAEPWSEGLRTELESRLGIRAVDNYGLTEVLGPGVSFECPARRGLHINEDHFIAEVIDPATLAVMAPGEEGELVLTTISKEGFPLVRYRTGDLTTLDPSPCSCGRTLARMARIRGRIDDMINLGDVKVFPSQVEEVLVSTEGVEPHYEIVLDRVDGIDTLEVRVEIAEDMPEVDEVRAIERLKERIARRLAASLAIPAKVTLAEPRTLARAGEGKLKRVVDRRTP
jgi:phenylacetate-CoA ligase